MGWADSDSSLHTVYIYISMAWSHHLPRPKRSSGHTPAARNRHKTLRVRLINCNPARSRPRKASIHVDVQLILRVPAQHHCCLISRTIKQNYHSPRIHKMCFQDIIVCEICQSEEYLPFTPCTNDDCIGVRYARIAYICLECQLEYYQPE